MRGSTTALFSVLIFVGVLGLTLFMPEYVRSAYGQTPTPAPDPIAPDEVGLPMGFAEDVAVRGPARNVFRSGSQTVGIFSTQSENYELAPGVWRRKKAQLRTDGSDGVSDDNDVVVRLTNSPTRIQITDRAGNGIAFPLAARAVRVDDTTFTATVGAITLTYHLTTHGVKAEATFTQRLGAQTWTLDYTLLGTATASIAADGSLQVGLFTLPRPVAVGADGIQYAIATAWELRPGSRVRVTVDDSSLPDLALPYVLDPTTTFDSIAANDTGMTSNGTLPLTTGSCGGFDVNVISLGWEHSGSTYTKRMALWKWDTSGIGAGAAVTAAKLQLRIHDYSSSADALSQVAEWTDWGTCDASDWSQNPISEADGLWAGTKAINTFTVNTYNDWTGLTNLNNISRTGTTYMKVVTTCPGGNCSSEQTGSNITKVLQAEFGTPVKLVVTYDAATPTATSAITMTPTPSPTPPPGCCDCEGRNLNNCIAPILVANTPTCPTLAPAEPACTYVPNAECAPR